MEVQEVKIREQISVDELNSNFNKCVDIINQMVDKHNYKLTNEKSLFENGPDFSKLTTRTSRKKMAKRLHYLINNPSRRNINSMFRFLKCRDMVILNISVKLSDKEREIQRKRKVWTIMRDKAQQALNEYKEEKGNFYKKKLV